MSANFNTPFHLKARAFFPQGVVTNCLPQLHLLIKKHKRTCQKSETQFFGGTCWEANAVLIVFFRLFLAGVEHDL